MKTDLFRFVICSGKLFGACLGSGFVSFGVQIPI